MLKSFLLFILIVTLSQATPLWYKNNSYKTNNHTYYGYGQGSTKESAYQDAASEISNQLKIEISSTLQNELRVRNENATSSFSNSISSNSHATLKNIKIIQTVQEEDNYYILLQYNYTTPFWYESRTLEAPLFSKVGFGQASSQNGAISNARKDLIAQGVKITKDITPIKSEIIAGIYFVAVSYQQIPKLKCHNYQNDFLSHTPLIEEANRLTHCKYDYKLNYLNGGWSINYKTFSHKLTPIEFSNLLVSVKSDSLSISTYKYDFIEGEGFHLDIKSKKSGYITIFDVYEDGRVGVILQNRKVRKNTNFRFPSKESGQEFVASLLVPSVKTKDMYVFLYSKYKLDLNTFEMQTTKKVADKEYRFYELLRLLSDYAYATLIVRTRPN